MKIKLQVDGYDFTCFSEDCAFRKECANHISAGDYRSEGGLTPYVYKIGEEYHCHTADCEIDPEHSEFYPNPVGGENNGEGRLQKIPKEQKRMSVIIVSLDEARELLVNFYAEFMKNSSLDELKTVIRGEGNNFMPNIKAMLPEEIITTINDLCLGKEIAEKHAAELVLVNIDGYNYKAIWDTKNENCCSFGHARISS